MPVSQHLTLAEDLFENFYDESKYASIRSGKRDIVPGPLVFSSPDGAINFGVTVTRVSYVRFSNLDEQDAYFEGSASVEEMRETLLRFYPNLLEDDLVTVVLFTY